MRAAGQAAIRRRRRPAHDDGCRARARVFCLFSKHLPELGWSDLAGGQGRRLRGRRPDRRAGGHVLPERAADDLPRAIDAIKAQGVQVPMITTELTSASAPVARPLLQAAAQERRAVLQDRLLALLVVARRPRAGGRRRERRWRDWRRSPASAASNGLPQPPGLHRRRALGHRARSWIVSIRGGPATTSIRGTRLPRAAAERGRRRRYLVAPRLKMVAIKDCLWVKSAKGWEIENCPLGEGLVDWTFVGKALREAQFAGPISLHLEYEIPAGTRHTLDAAMRDLAFARRFLA